MESKTLTPHVPAGFEDFLIACRRHMHQYPEIGFQEFETSKFIRATLESRGLVVQGPLAKTGLFVDIRGAQPRMDEGPHIGYRADIDALPIQDAKTVPYSSKNAGCAHLCGHDVHTTVAIGVALLLHENRDMFSGKVRVFFQPNEEGNPSGAPELINEGILQGLEAAYAIHVDPMLPSRNYGIRKGAMTASAVRFNITVSNSSTGHSARPHQTIDTVWVATQIASQLYQLVGRFTDPRDATILTICRFFAGEAFNVIPASVEFGGTLRSTSLETRHKMESLIESTARTAATGTGAKITVAFDAGIPPVLNDDRLVDHVLDNISTLYNPSSVTHIALPSMGGEDFANYQQFIPGALVRVGTSNGPDTSYPLHDANFDVDETAILPAAQLMANVLMSHVNRRLEV